MTDRSRTRFYLPAWTRAWKRLKALAQLPTGTTTPEALIQQVYAVAARHEKPGTPDAVRHACHVVALGRDVSSKQMTAAQADRCVLLFRLLANPDDRGALIGWQRDGGPDRARLLWRLRNSGFTTPYISAIAADQFGESDLEQLNPTQLHNLVRTLSARARAREQRALNPIPAQP